MRRCQRGHPFEFVRLPITAFLAYVFFTEVPGIWAIVGAGVIFFGTWRLATRRRSLNRLPRTGSLTLRGIQQI